MAIRDIEDKRARQRAKERGLPGNQRKAPGRLVEGATAQGWKQALGALALTYPDRLAPTSPNHQKINLHRDLDKLQLLLSSTLLLPDEPAPLTQGWEIKERLDRAVDAVLDSGDCVPNPQP